MNKPLLFLSAALAVAALAIATRPAAAQQSAASAAAKGRVTPLSVQVTDPKLPQAQVKALTAQAEAILQNALATPALATPRGFSLSRSLRIHAQPDGMPPAFPATAEAIMIPQMINLEAGAKPDASGAYMGRLEGPTFRVHLNSFSALFANAGWSDKPLEDFVEMPKRLGAVGGLPVYRVGIRDVILITKPGRDPFVSVTKGQWLQRRIAETRADIARMGGVPHPTMAATLSGYQKGLDALSPQDRDSPACASSSLHDFFGDCAAGDGRYMRINPDFFDRSLPKGAVQMVAISTPAEGGHGHKILEPKLRATASAMDVAAIQASLD